MPTKKNSKLNAADRVLIYQRIEMKDSMSAMARKVGVSTKTVINEIKRNVVSESPMFLSQKGRNLCKKAGRCTVTSLCEGGCIASCSKCTKVSCNEMCPDYEPEPCPLLEKPPYCCNTCHSASGTAVYTSTISTTRISPKS